MKSHDAKEKLEKLWTKSDLYTDAITKLTVSPAFEAEDNSSAGIRGIKNLELEFKYPITVICGQNRCGKTTVLNLCALAYDAPASCPTVDSNDSKHYTCRDFFCKSFADSPVENVQVVISMKDGKSTKMGKNKPSAQWCRYRRRKKKAVYFVRLSRALPLIEQKYLQSLFRKNNGYKEELLNDKINKYLGEIFGTTYTGAKEYKVKRRAMDVCNTKRPYSAFNMGLGEQAALSILKTLIYAPDNSLIIIEEIETGLHPEAQKKLMEILFEICVEKRTQILITTHSKMIIDTAPKQARILLIAGEDAHDVTYSPTTDYALANLEGCKKAELNIIVEDEFAKKIIKKAIDNDLVKRVEVIPIGANSELAKATKYIRKSADKKNLIVWDGDVSEKKAIDFLKSSLLLLPDDITCLDNSFYGFLPGNVAPERWIANEVLDLYSDFASEFRITRPDGESKYSTAIRSEDHHDIFHSLAVQFDLDKAEVESKLIKLAVDNNEDARKYLNNIVKYALENNSQTERFPSRIIEST